ncbi:MAG: hypothetical protein ACTSQE_11920 [Candidatus Heimdallarchaeaceae archaeon]
MHSKSIGEQVREQLNNKLKSKDCAIVPMIIGVILLFQQDRKNIRFKILSFSIVSLISFITYVIFPAAAPWYVTKYEFNSPDSTTAYKESNSRIKQNR